MAETMIKASDVKQKMRQRKIDCLGSLLAVAGLLIVLLAVNVSAARKARKGDKFINSTSPHIEIQNDNQ